ncbi:hypothetical protein STPYR_20006 [uncultured Stenotrophomonas sp.]|uniref:Uncharacterized protein n=1 Tax=uncultured Stenotrophomonas sp. TaxID=165438 RepID=A0A1Y5Q775_9GAMM|nr:hypothetical protein STPYR_20006 [uncultured Stenotrophomonas sp.]
MRLREAPAPGCNLRKPACGLKRPKAGGLRPQPWLHRRDSMATQGNCLLQLDGRAGGFQVLLELLGVFLRSAFLHDATGFGQVLRFLQAQAGDGANGLDDLDLLGAGILQDDVELGLLFGSGGRAGGGGHGNRGSGGNAELVFDGLDQLHHFHQGLLGDGVDDLLVGKGHFDYLWKIFWDSGSVRNHVNVDSGGFGSRLGSFDSRTTFLLLTNSLDGAREHGDRLGQDAGQHGQGLITGRQRCQHVDVAGREHFPADCHDLRLQLVVALGRILDQATGGAGLLERKRIQQRTDHLVLCDCEIGAFNGARGQRVLDNLQENTGFAGLLAHRGHLGDRGASVFGCDQGVGLGGDVCQLGDYFLLLGQIESHCTPPIELRLRLLPCAVLSGIRPGRREHRGDAPVVAIPDLECAGPDIPDPRETRKTPEGRHHLRRVIREESIKRSRCPGGDSLPDRASLPVAGMR